MNATTVTDRLPPVGVHHRAAPVVATIVVAVVLVAAANPVAGRTPGLPLERLYPHLRRFGLLPSSPVSGA